MRDALCGVITKRVEKVAVRRRVFWHELFGCRFPKFVQRFFIFRYRWSRNIHSASAHGSTHDLHICGVVASSDAASLNKTIECPLPRNYRWCAPTVRSPHIHGGDGILVIVVVALSISRNPASRRTRSAPYFVIHLVDRPAELRRHFFGERAQLRD